MDRPLADQADKDLSAGKPAGGSPPLTAAQFALFSGLTRWLPSPAIVTRRRRRFLFLALAAPGFFAVFGTPLHHSLIAMVLGFLLFGAAVAFRLRTEPVFERAEAADLWPSPERLHPSPKESPRA